MGRTWEYADGTDELVVEYWPGGTISIIAHNNTQGTTEIVGLPYHKLFEMLDCMQGHRLSDPDYEPVGYHVIPDHPWPGVDGWVIAWWNEEYGQWCAGGVTHDRDEAVKRIRGMRAQNPDFPLRLVREQRIYIAEEE